MKVGVISDTHDQRDNIIKAVKKLNQEQVELLVHCGDWIAPFTLKFYSELKCPMKGVFGNNDGDKFRHTTRTGNYPFQLHYEERFMKLTLDNRKIAVFHGDYKEIVDALVKCGDWDAVFWGHTHQAVNETIGNTLSLNPGTMMEYTDEDTQGASFAIYDTSTNSAQLIKL